MASAAQPAGQAGHNVGAYAIIHVAPAADFLKRTTATDAMTGKRRVFIGNRADAAAGREGFRCVHGRHIGRSGGEGKGGKNRHCSDLLRSADRVAGMATKLLVDNASKGESGKNSKSQRKKHRAQMIAR